MMLYITQFLKKYLVAKAGLLVILLIPRVSFGEAISRLNLNTYSWSIENGMMKVIDASASPDAAAPSTAPWCISSGGKAICGVALAVFNENNVGGFYILSSGPSDSYSAQEGANAINALPGRKFSFSQFNSVVNASNAAYSCLYNYMKDEGDRYSILNGPCSGGNIPPVPTPISCNLSLPSGNTIDFGDISAAQFTAAGAGNTLAGITPQSRELRITCSKASSSPAYIRLNTINNASGKVIVSDNRDAGFVLTGNNGISNSTLIPNAINSKMEVRFYGSSSASAKITALPASVTGKRPKAGKFSSMAILSIIWN